MFLLPSSSHGLYTHIMKEISTADHHRFEETSLGVDVCASHALTQ